MEKCWSQRNATEQIKELFVDIFQQGAIDSGEIPAKRAVFRKPHGVAYGYFEMLPGLPEHLKVGVFALEKLEAWIRFSSDTTPGSADLKTTCGVGIKLFGVKGEKLLGDGETHDFILQNHDVFFVDDARAMAEFTAISLITPDRADAYLKAHPRTQEVLNEMEKVVASVLTTNYWSVLPYAFGKKSYVKYKLEPINQPEGEPFNDNDYLALDMQSRLRKGAASFKFMVQFQTNTETMPLDKATVRWSETESKPIHLATLHIPQQDICQRGQAEYGENLAYNPWHCLKEHEPQGSISQARKVVYEASAEKRHGVNGIPTQEPKCPYHAKLLSETRQKESEDTCIVSAAIYPPIGVRRIGNSEEFFIGPEVNNPLPEKPGFYRDAKGAIKRQAARFRIFGLNAKGNPVRELTSAEAKISWHVHMANKKSAWYEFKMALDIPEAAQMSASMLRNALISDRSQLIIDPGKDTISGNNAAGKPLKGHFMGIEVYLGELRTDEAGRLVVLGGYGKSGSYDGTRAVTFANNEGWYDDTSDGPVTAGVEFNGMALEVLPAWVITAPPNYAPMQKSVRTMWDLMRDVAIKANMLPRPAMPSFTQDILPIFERMTRLQWVNAGFAGGFGFGGVFNYSTPEWIKKLSNPTPAYREQRLIIANHFRFPDREPSSSTSFPWLYGDSMDFPGSVHQYTCLSDTQLGFLEQWANGDFIADYDPQYQPPRNLEEVPPSQQADMLTRAAMEFCIADAFHPGCEMTWPMRLSTMYQSAFRLLHAPKGWKEPNYGAILNNDVLQLPSGPTQGGQVPGGVTRWMAIPWQTDTASCSSGYPTTYDPYLATFWPARVPNDVMPEEAYETVMDTGKEFGQRLQAFANRAKWQEPLGLDQPYTHQINFMIEHFDQMGIVEVREGLTNDTDFPATMEVQDSKRPSKESADAFTLAEIEEAKTEKHLKTRIAGVHPADKAVKELPKNSLHPKKLR